jgi:hypothetical protein
LYFPITSETINAAAGSFRILVVGAPGASLSVPLTLAGTATPGTDYVLTSGNPLPVYGFGLITGTLISHPGGANQTLTFTLDWPPRTPPILLEAAVNTLTIIEPPLSNQASTIASDLAAVSADEGGTVTNTGTFQDLAGNSTLTASLGTITQNNALGTWSWSLNLADGPLVPTAVTITATDGQGASASTTFTYQANLVPLTIALSGSAAVNEGAPYTLNLGAITDPGQDPITGYTIDWGDGASDTFSGSPANTTATHTYDDGPATLAPMVTLTDDDGDFLAGSLAVNVLSVAPTGALSTNSGISYGSAATASFSNPFDPSGADTAAGFHYAFAIDTDTTGSATYANSGASSSANFGIQGAGPHTVFARIIDQDDGFTPYVSNFTVVPAGSTVMVGLNDTAPIVYDSKPHGATARWISTGSDGEQGPLTVSYVGINGTVYRPSATAPTNAGDYEASATYTGDDNHFGNSSFADFTISKASASVVVAPYTVTYDGSPHTTTVTSITGVNGETGSAAGTVTLSTTHTGAGTYSDSWSFTGAGNYNDIAGTTIADTINKATPTLTVTDPGGTYDGATAFAATATVAGAGTITGNATLDYYDNTTSTDMGSIAPNKAGNYTVTATYAGDANHTGSSASTTFDILKATLPIVVTSDMMLVGNPTPALTGTVNGTPFTSTITLTTALGDLVTVTLSTLANSTSPVGPYAITATLSGTAAANYFTPAAGLMSVVSIGMDGNGAPQGINFWDASGNAALITAADFAALASLNLERGAGNTFDPTTAAQLDQFFRTANAQNAFASLSAQLAVMDLNVLSGRVLATSIVYAGNLLQYVSSPLAAYTTGLDGGGFISIGDLLADANAALGNSAIGMSSYGNDYRILLLNLATDLLNANNNSSFAG